MSGFVQKFFDDKRYTSVILITWMVLVWCIFTELGLMEANFIHFGPGEHVHVMGLVLDTWYKWGCIVVFTFVSTSINAFVGDAIMPFITNTIQDHKTRYIPYSKVTCIIITQTWTVYCCVMGVFALFVMLSQIDFMLVRIVGDVLVNIYTSYSFMRNKKVDRERYNKWMRKHEDDDDDEEEIMEEFKKARRAERAERTEKAEEKEMKDKERAEKKANKETSQDDIEASDRDTLLISVKQGDQEKRANEGACTPRA